MNIDLVKKEFPIFDEKIQNNDLVYLDSANSSQKPKVVVDRINEFYTKQFSNVGRSVHYLAVAATNLYENTRTSVQKYINAKPELEIYADDVKCSHGSTSGNIDENSIFYLMSRGLSYSDSKKLLTNGFLNEVIEKITNENIKNFVKKITGIEVWT